jgi:hypothetical protein
MLIKEAIVKVARELKREKEIEYQDSSILDGYPQDLNEEEIRQAMVALSAVSDVIFKLQ